MRNIYMAQTVKGVYLKFRGGSNDSHPVISNVKIQNVTMDDPLQF